MATRESYYASGEAGYNAMVSDFSAMFDWDTGAPTGVPYTEFRKNCGDNTYVALRIKKPATEGNRPTMLALVSKNGGLLYTAEASYNYHASYVSGNGFFVVCTSSDAQPYIGAYKNILGVSTCRSIITGETGWCAFGVAFETGNYPKTLYSYTLYSKESTTSFTTSWAVSTGAKIGGAVSMHNPATGCVSDKIMVLTAIPDSYSACLSSVVFNGVPYTRVGHLLVPTA